VSTGTTRSGRLPTDPTKFIDQVFPRYAPSTGPDRYARFIHEVLGLQRTYVQDRILEALDQHKQTVVVAANGVGKSYIAAAGGIAALYCNPDTIVNVTAGNSGTLKTNIWKPARSLFRDSVLTSVLPGRTLDGSREIRTGLDDEWFFECVSPRYPDDLEGPHNDHVIYIVEEANKPGVTADHIEAVRSTATDGNDRALVISNPPKTESNVVHSLLQSDEWHTLQFGSWDTHNVRIDRGLSDGEKIGGLAATSKLVDDWNEYHSEPWPGLEQAIRWSDPWLGSGQSGAVVPGDTDAIPNDDFRTDLDERWYRRRAGIMPPGDASVHRPLDPQLVDAAYDPDATPARHTPTALGIDVARSGDDTVAVGPHDDHLVVEYAEQGTDHTAQEQALAEHIRAWPALEIAVDAVGEGSGLADGLATRFGDVTRFKAGAEAVDGTTYDRRWGEALAAFADYLEAGGTISDRDLYEQAKVAARTVTWDERHIASRGRDGADVLSASPKDEVTERLGRSPDHFDAAIMATWIASTDPTVDDRATQATISW
jgi:hypothetical protein